MRLAACMTIAANLVLGCRPPQEAPPPEAPLVPMTQPEQPAAAGGADPDPPLDREDLCPQRDEDPDGHRDDDGCPDADNDQDGVSDREDACPDVPAPDDPDQDGCPAS